MKATKVLYDLGQSLWLDNITRDLLTCGTLKKYIESLSVTGLTTLEPFAKFEPWAGSSHFGGRHHLITTGGIISLWRAA
jgi:hypothetical protein